MDLRLATLKLCQLAGKVFAHKCDTGNLSALIQCWNIVQQIERDCFSVAKRRSIYTTLAFLALLGAPYIYMTLVA